MRILLLTHRLPYPPNKGDKIRTFNVLEHLASAHEVLLACPVDDPADLAFVPELEKPLRARHRGADPQQPRGRGRERACSPARRSPCGTFIRASCSRASTRCWTRATSTPCSAFPRPWPNTCSARGMPTASCVARCGSWISSTSIRSSGGSTRERSARAAALGVRLRSRAPRRTTSSGSPRVRSLVPGQRAGARIHACRVARVDHVQALSNGVDLEYFAPRGAAGGGAPTLVFTGVMDYWPNVQGVQWFADDVLPRIHAVSCPTCASSSWAQSPPKPYGALAERPGIEVTGFVRRRARLRARGGRVRRAAEDRARRCRTRCSRPWRWARRWCARRSRSKAFARRRASAVLVAGDAEEFAARVVELLESPERAASIGCRRAALHGTELLVGGQPACRSIACWLQRRCRGAGSPPERLS